MSLAATIRAMASAGCTVEQIAAVAAHFESIEESALSSKREKAAARQRKSRLSRNVTVTARDACDQKGSNGSPYDNINSTPSLPPKTSSLRSDNKPPRENVTEILETCLTPQTAADLIAHRKAKRSPMTPGAARLLAKAFVAFGNPELAAQTVIARGWAGFKPEWMAADARAGPAARPRSILEITLDEIAEIDRKAGAPELKLVGYSNG